jgi:hypothetical protein
MLDGSEVVKRGGQLKLSKQSSENNEGKTTARNEPLYSNHVQPPSLRFSNQAANTTTVLSTTKLLPVELSFLECHRKVCRVVRLNITVIHCCSADYPESFSFQNEGSVQGSPRGWNPQRKTLQ